MKKSTILFAAMVMFVLTSCSNSAPKTEEKGAGPAEKSCTYSISQDNPVTVSWTAYKTTKKVGVGGKFTKFSFTKGVPAASIAENIKGRKFKISTDSTNTGKPERDAKIVKYFWNKMVDTRGIIGTIKDAAGDDQTGKATISIRLNGEEHDANFTYKVGEKSVVFDGEIDLNDWHAEAAVASLNKACEKLHTGDDGVSKTWPNVSIKIEAGYTKVCK